ncbi:MAG TPA: hypothetical protein VMV95_02965 [Bacillota bacterium]|nr:hypothetical protein [Bacillota bacterium]
MIIQTRVYYPTDPEKFRKNLEKWVTLNILDGPKEIVHYNSAESMSKRTDNVLIYHALDATVFVNAPNDDRGRVNITAYVKSVPGEIESAKSLLEKITEIKLMERE